LEGLKADMPPDHLQAVKDLMAKHRKTEVAATETLKPATGGASSVGMKLQLKSFKKTQ
jgi:hypothetical protein